MKKQTVVERISARELAVSRTINGPLRIVFEAWTKPELFQRWWVPKSAPITLLSCEMDVRTGGAYRLAFSFQSQRKEFFGRYLEVTPCSRIVWTNDEDGEEASVLTTVTFQEVEGKTLLIMRELYPSKEALDAAIESGSTACGTSDDPPESFDQLAELIATLL